MWRYNKDYRNLIYILYIYIVSFCVLISLSVCVCVCQEYTVIQDDAFAWNEKNIIETTLFRKKR